jgi:hypothetical protein
MLRRIAYFSFAVSFVVVGVVADQKKNLSSTSAKATAVATNTITVATPGQFNSRIVGVNAQTGVVLARNNATGQTFLFAPKDRNLFPALKLGTPVNFARTRGVSIQGFPGGSFTPMKFPRGGGGKPMPFTVDCSATPEFCPGHQSKPGQNKLTKIGTTTWGDVIDYCYDSPDSCVPGPM